MSPRALVPMSTCTHGAITASGQCRHAQRVQHAQRSVPYRTVQIRAPQPRPSLALCNHFLPQSKDTCASGTTEA